MPPQAFCPFVFFLEEEVSVTVGTQNSLLEDYLASKGDFKFSGLVPWPT